VTDKKINNTSLPDEQVTGDMFESMAGYHAGGW
jgi:hypothetical protein